MKKFQLVAVSQRDKKSVIGYDKEMMWHCPDDFKLFRKITSGNVIIMGRKTYESIGFLLPDRTTIVVSSDPAKVKLKPHGSRFFQGMKVSSLEEAFDVAENSNLVNWDILWKYRFTKEPTIFVVGGAEIYKNTIDMVDGVIMSEIRTPIDMLEGKDPEKIVYYPFTGEEIKSRFPNNNAHTFFIRSVEEQRLKGDSYLAYVHFLGKEKDTFYCSMTRNEIKSLAISYNFIKPDEYTNDREAMRELILSNYEKQKKYMQRIFGAGTLGKPLSEWVRFTHIRDILLHGLEDYRGK